jgi:hypothetical protein
MSKETLGPVCGQATAISNGGLVRVPGSTALLRLATFETVRHGGGLRLELYPLRRSGSVNGLRPACTCWPGRL